jgi:hypothetical protein
MVDVGIGEVTGEISRSLLCLQMVKGMQDSEQWTAATQQRVKIPFISIFAA